jgi:hypothetical protein
LGLRIQFKAFGSTGDPWLPMAAIPGATREEAGSFQSAVRSPHIHGQINPLPIRRIRANPSAVLFFASYLHGQRIER